MDSYDPQDPFEQTMKILMKEHTRLFEADDHEGVEAVEFVASMITLSADSSMPQGEVAGMIREAYGAIKSEDLKDRVYFIMGELFENDE